MDNDFSWIRARGMSDTHQATCWRLQIHETNLFHHQNPKMPHFSPNEAPKLTGPLSNVIEFIKFDDFSDEIFIDDDKQHLTIKRDASNKPIDISDAFLSQINAKHEKPELSLIIDSLIAQSNNYQHFLSLQVTDIDEFFVDAQTSMQKLIEFGYRGVNERIVERDYLHRKRMIENALRSREAPSLAEQWADSSGLDLSHHTLLGALQRREVLLKRGDLVTIMYLRMRIDQHEVSAFIDYSHRLASESWIPIFNGEKTIRPRKDDLLWYNWTTNKTYTRASDAISISEDYPDHLRFLHRESQTELVCDALHDESKPVSRLSAKPVAVCNRIDLGQCEGYQQVVMYDWRVSQWLPANWEEKEGEKIRYNFENGLKTKVFSMAVRLESEMKVKE